MFKKLLLTCACMLPLQAIAVDEVDVDVTVLLDEEAPAPYERVAKTNIFGIDFSKPYIDVDALHSTSFVDQIPVIMDPSFIPLRHALENDVTLTENAYGIVFQYAGKTKVYPLKYMNWHNGVEDELGGEEFFIVWDPLTLFTTAWPMDDKESFGVSGFVYDSQTLYFDMKTKGLWHPMLSKALTGSMSGEPIERLHTFVAKLGDVFKAEPRALVMTENTGFERPYDTSPYYEYMRNKSLLFPVKYVTETNVARKEIVLGLNFYTTREQVNIAIPVNSLIEAFSKRSEEDKNKPMKLSFMRAEKGWDEPFTFSIYQGEIEGDFTVVPPAGMELRQTVSYWFAFSSLFSDTMVIKHLPE